MPAVITRPFRALPPMGVIRVNQEAMRIGYRMGDPAWSNLGQGQPEVGPIPGAPPRLETLAMTAEDHAYGPVEGLAELREAVAAHYNRLYRKGKASQYTAANVAIAPGGRAALTRCGAALDTVRIGHCTPDYTAYEDLLTTFHRIDPVWLELRPEDGFRADPDAIFDQLAREGAGALLLSNPCNPTGVAIHGPELAAWVERARRDRVTLLMDEFYSHYNFTSPTADGPISAAEFVEDVNQDQTLLFDGLTKCFRYPGWRVGWVIGPESIIQTLTAAGSFADGGPSRPIQRAAVEVLEPARADQETSALRARFGAKRRLTLERLGAMGVEFPAEPVSTFYAFGSVAGLPAPLNTGKGFMREAFKRRVLTVPGEFFDVNPHKRREGPSSLEPFVRFSFGPPTENLTAGLDRLAEMVQELRG